MAGWFSCYCCCCFSFICCALTFCSLLLYYRIELKSLSWDVWICFLFFVLPYLYSYDQSTIWLCCCISYLLTSSLRAQINLLLLLFFPLHHSFRTETFYNKYYVSEYMYRRNEEWMNAWEDERLVRREDTFEALNCGSSMNYCKWWGDAWNQDLYRNACESNNSTSFSVHPSVGRRCKKMIISWNSMD